MSVVERLKSCGVWQQVCEKRYCGINANSAVRLCEQVAHEQHAYTTQPGRREAAVWASVAAVLDSIGIKIEAPNTTDAERVLEEVRRRIA